MTSFRYSIIDSKPVLLMSTSKANNTGGWIASHKVLSSLLVVAVVIACLLAYASSTAVQGVEFNVDNWQVRSFSFRRDPFTNRQLTAVKHSTAFSYAAWSDNPTETGSILNNSIAKYLKPNKLKTGRWDLVYISDGNLHQGPAAIIYDLLETRTPNYDSFWVDWSDKHPKKAAILWPAVAQLCELKLYAAIPEIARLARQDIDLPTFESEVNSCMLDAINDYCEHADLTKEQESEALDAAEAYRNADRSNANLK